jgi:hypothetical protein
MLSDRLVLMLSLVVADVVERIEDILLWVGPPTDLPESTPPEQGQLGEQPGAGTVTRAATTKPRRG